MSFIKNMSYTISSNLISLFVSTLVILIIPKLIGVEKYGYWQLYLFYSSYVGFLHFGWNDGIYLRYGGDEYDSLDKKLLFSQFIMLFCFQLFVGVLMWILGSMVTSDTNRYFIIRMVGVALIIVNTRYMLIYILQATNKIKQFAKITISDRVIYIIIITLLLIMGVRDYRLMIVADLLGKFISLVYAVIFCKDIVIQNLSEFKLDFNETILNISTGIKLMFANIASVLIIGIVRFGIERTWDVATFGKISLTLSISNMTMIFINAIGIIMFPILRRTNQDKLPNIYTIMRDFLMVILLGLLLIYYPVKFFISAWLPQYAESLRYMALVFPIFIYEGKMALLINTYLKTLRKEKLMLKVNLLSMVLSLILTFISTSLLRNLDFAIFSIVLLLSFRSLLAERHLAKELKIAVNKDIILELLLTLSFILSGWLINSWVTTLIYGVVYVSYLFIKRKDIVGTIHNIKSLIKA